LKIGLRIAVFIPALAAWFIPDRGWLFWALVAPLFLTQLLSASFRGRIPWVVICLGGFLNASVSLANGGHMPCVWRGPIDPGDHAHILLTSATHLPWLADIYGKPGVVMVSLGDMILVFGLVLFLAIGRTSCKTTSNS
jgi:uncharacterized protein DUF5317